MKTLPPSSLRLWAKNERSAPARNERKYNIGLGNDIGQIQTADGAVSGGGLLMIDSWNAALYGELATDYAQNKHDSRTLLHHKVRCSFLVELS